VPSYGANPYVVPQVQWQYPLPFPCNQDWVSPRSSGTYSHQPDFSSLPPPTSLNYFAPPRGLFNAAHLPEEHPFNSNGVWDGSSNQNQPNFGHAPHFYDESCYYPIEPLPNATPATHCSPVNQHNIGQLSYQYPVYGSIQRVPNADTGHLSFPGPIFPSVTAGNSQAIDAAVNPNGDYPQQLPNFVEVPEGFPHTDKVVENTLGPTFPESTFDVGSSSPDPNWDDYDFTEILSILPEAVRPAFLELVWP
jgi:hypothetical protein